jgi:hypothetical protein
MNLNSDFLLSCTLRIYPFQFLKDFPLYKSEQSLLFSMQLLLKSGHDVSQKTPTIKHTYDLLSGSSQKAHKQESRSLKK